MEIARLRLMEDLLTSLEQTKIISKELLILDKEDRVSQLTKIFCMESLMRCLRPLISIIQSKTNSRDPSESPSRLRTDQQVEEGTSILTSIVSSSIQLTTMIMLLTRKFRQMVFPYSLKRIVMTSMEAVAATSISTQGPRMQETGFQD